MKGQEDRAVEYFVIAVKQPDGTPAEATFAYPQDGGDITDFCESVAMFMFPHAFGFNWDPRALPPPPMHNIFALTDVNGDHLYGASLCFYEAIHPLSDKSTRSTSKDSESSIPSSSSMAKTYRGKSICLLSKRSYYTRLLLYLEHLFLLGVRQARMDGVTDDKNDKVVSAEWNAVEKTLCNLFHEVPAPYPGVAIQINVGGVDIVLEQLLVENFPFETDPELLVYAFMTVDPKVLVQLYHHVLLEHRILVVGPDNVLVTAIVETLKSLIFPLTWLHVFIPNIPDLLDLSTLLEAPVPFIAGAHEQQLEDVVVPDNVVKLRCIAGRFVLDANTSPMIKLPHLPDVSHKLASKLAMLCLPDVVVQQREFLDKLWDRRIRLQKRCMMMDKQCNTLENAVQEFFLMRPSSLNKKVMTFYLEIMTTVLQGYPSCTTDSVNQFSFDTVAFTERKPANEQAYYHELLETAQFQAFIGKYNDFMNRSVSPEEMIKLEFVHKVLVNEPRKANEPLGPPSSMNKKFVAHRPQVLEFWKDDHATRASDPLEAVNTDARFPEINVSAFGTPRAIEFPTAMNDIITSSTVTSSITAKTHSHDTGLEWMQSLLKSVSMTSSVKKQDITPKDSPAPFKRSQTIDRLKAATPFYRTMTQNPPEATPALFSFSNATMQSRQVGKTRVAPIIKSIWLVTTASCVCKEKIVDLTETLTQVLNEHDKSTSRASDAYCELIQALEECGHPGEAKAVFEECVGGSELVTLESIASYSHFWKPFSSLIRCYISNGLVQRAFDLLAQVKIDGEQHLDPSFGSSQFPAKILAFEKQVLLERVHATFSCGDLGIELGPRENDDSCRIISVQHSESHQIGSEDDNNQLRRSSQCNRNTLNSRCLDGVMADDIIEMINGEMVLHNTFMEISNCLKHAYRPITLTLLRGMANMEGIRQAPSDESSQGKTFRTNSWKYQPADTSKSPPRRDLCDYFGLLPQKGIRITTLADCNSCGARASLSDIQDGWSLTDPNDYTSRCAQCGLRYVPRLCVMHGVSTHTAPDVRVEQFEYLSMLVIRKELVNLSHKIPLTMVSMVELRKMNPRIYWNIVVKLLPLACPLDFLDLPDSINAIDDRDVENNNNDDIEVTTLTEELESEEFTDAMVMDDGKDTDALKHLFTETVRKLMSANGSTQSFETVANGVLHQLQIYAEEMYEDDAEVSTGSDSEHEDDDERSCRTLSLAESSSVQDPAHDDEVGINVIESHNKNMPKEDDIRAPVTNASAPFQRSHVHFVFENRKW